MADDKLLCGLNYKSLNFTDAQYEEALKMIKKPESANQLLLALLDISTRGDTSNAAFTTASTTTTDTCSITNPSISQMAEEETGFLMTNSKQEVKEIISSGYASVYSLPSSSNQSLLSLHQPLGLRKIYVDGSNVAKTHGKNATFSWIGIQICVEWFHSRQHFVRVFVPAARCKLADKAVLDYLNVALIETPSGCNDDLFVIEAARMNNGIIVSNDQYREEKEFDHELRRFIDHNRLSYVFVEDLFIPAKDPRGRAGPSLEDFLKDFPETVYHHNKLQRQRHQRNWERSHQVTIKPSRPKPKPTCSVPTNFMKN